MEKIEFYYAPDSRAEMVMWALLETDLVFELKPINFKKQEQKSPHFLKINPLGKVPTIVIENTVLTEVGAILTFLGDIVPNKNLAPKVGTTARAKYLRMLFTVPSVLEPAMADKFRKLQLDDGSQVGWGALPIVIEMLSNYLTTHQFVTGNNFSMADISLSMSLDWFIQFGMMESSPVIKEYCKNCMSRPAFIAGNRKKEEIKAELETIA